MSKIKVIMLLKNKECIIKNIKSNSKQFIYDSGLYPIGIDKIKNWELNEKIRGSEIIFFEGNPIAIGDRKLFIESIEKDKSIKRKDESSLYLDSLLLENALRQTSQQKTDFNKIKGAFEYIFSPYNIMILLFVGALIWGFSSGFKI